MDSFVCAYFFSVYLVRSPWTNAELRESHVYARLAHILSVSGVCVIRIDLLSRIFGIWKSANNIRGGMAFVAKSDIDLHLFSMIVVVLVLSDVYIFLLLFDFEHLFIHLCIRVFCVGETILATILDVFVRANGALLFSKAILCI